MAFVQHYFSRLKLVSFERPTRPAIATAAAAA